MSDLVDGKYVGKFFYTYAVQKHAEPEAGEILEAIVRSQGSEIVIEYEEVERIRVLVKSTNAFEYGGTWSGSEPGGAVSLRAYTSPGRIALLGSWADPSEGGEGVYIFELESK